MMMNMNMNMNLLLPAFNTALLGTYGSTAICYFHEPCQKEVIQSRKGKMELN